MTDTRPGLARAVLGAPVGLAGTALGVAFAVTAGLRRGKPLHPVGVVAPAVLEVRPSAPLSGSPLIDDEGTHDCLVRASYAIGTGPEHADIEGFALRVLYTRAAGVDEAGPTDLLFASTGVQPWARHVLTLRPPARHGSQTTLLPVRAAGKPLLLRLEPLDPWTQPWPSTHELSWAHGEGPWLHFGTLTIDWAGPSDAPERFDPVANVLPGTSQYPVVAGLREPAYRWSRWARPSAGRLAGEHDDD